MEQVCERRNLLAALERVRRNAGSPGIDGMTVEDLTGYLRVEWPRIREELLAERYQPQAIRRVTIAKPDGGERELGIPTVLIPAPLRLAPVLGEFEARRLPCASIKCTVTEFFTEFFHRTAGVGGVASLGPRWFTDPEQPSRAYGLVLQGESPS